MLKFTMNYTVFTTTFVTVVIICLQFKPTLAQNLKDNLGCALVPSISGNNHVQDDILRNLNDHNLFGKRFTCSGNHDRSYEFMVCGDVIDKKPNAAVVRHNNIQGRIDAIGMRNATKVSGHFKGEWVMLNFGGGDKDLDSIECKNKTLSSSVMIICDKDQRSGKLSLLYEDKSFCSFMFELRTAAICEGYTGLSGWSIFVIIVLVGFFLYFAAGFCYLRFVIGAKGIDQIPHRQFWFMLGDKFSDCCGAVCRCSQHCGGNEMDVGSIQSPYSSEYSPIGESGPTTYGNHSSTRDAPLIAP